MNKKAHYIQTACSKAVGWLRRNVAAAVNFPQEKSANGFEGF
jgi:hypothetical protein